MAAVTRRRQNAPSELCAGGDQRRLGAQVKYSACGVHFIYDQRFQLLKLTRAGVTCGRKRAQVIQHIAVICHRIGVAQNFCFNVFEPIRQKRFGICGSKGCGGRIHPCAAKDLR